jgi:hypothetical protein
MTMICSICGRAGIRWMGPLSALTHTECPHCGNQNCQRPNDYNEAEGCPILSHDPRDMCDACDCWKAREAAAAERGEA